MRLVLGLSLLLAGSLSAQQAATISVTGAVAQPLMLTAADLGALPRATASISGKGSTTTYEGVWVSDVLKKAGVPIRSALRRPRLAGGRTIASGPNAGVGRLNPNKAPSVHGFSLTNDEKRDLLAFLETLTDTVFLRNPAYANSWRQR